MLHRLLDDRPRYGAKRLDLEKVLAIASQLSLVLIALFALMYTLDYAQIVLAPIFLGVVIGLMFAPIAGRLERRGVPCWLSSTIIVFLFLGLVIAAAIAFSLPLQTWIDRAPEIWRGLQLQVASWKDLLASISAFQSQLADLAGQAGAMTVNVNDGAAVENMATLAPSIVAQTLLFFVSLYFFIATRQNLRLAILQLCFSRRLRLRVARFFRDVEFLIARYLLSITAINLTLGLAVALALWAIDVPSPLLWGGLAALLNYVIYIGPAVMAVLLLGVSLATRHGGMDILLPPALYLFLNFIESQFVTNQVLGMTMTINPFAVFLSLTFWLWLWGPIGGFIAVPSLLIVQALIRTILPLASPPRNVRSPL